MTEYTFRVDCESQPLHIGKETVDYCRQFIGWSQNPVRERGGEFCLKIILIMSIIDVELIF